MSFFIFPFVSSFYQESEEEELFLLEEKKKNLLREGVLSFLQVYETEASFSCAFAEKKIQDFLLHSDEDMPEKRIVDEFLTELFVSDTLEIKTDQQLLTSPSAAELLAAKNEYVEKVAATRKLEDVLNNLKSNMENIQNLCRILRFDVTKMETELQNRQESVRDYQFYVHSSMFLSFGVPTLYIHLVLL